MLLPDITSSGRNKDNSTGNHGFRDTRLALQWVQDHIAQFGGDPTRVLIAGQSSGAGTVSAHLVAQRSFGLFSRAAMHSGAFGYWIASAWTDVEDDFIAVGKVRY